MRTCDQCGGPVEGRSDKRFCGARCRVAAARGWAQGRSSPPDSRNTEPVSVTEVPVEAPLAVTEDPVEPAREGAHDWNPVGGLFRCRRCGSYRAARADPSGRCPVVVVNVALARAQAESQHRRRVDRGEDYLAGPDDWVEIGPGLLFRP